MNRQQARIEALLEQAASHADYSGAIPLDLTVDLLEEGYDFRGITRDLARLNRKAR
jgi:hypothetical protein